MTDRPLTENQQAVVEATWDVELTCYCPNCRMPDHGPACCCMACINAEIAESDDD